MAEHLVNIKSIFQLRLRLALMVLLPHYELIGANQFPILLHTELMKHVPPLVTPETYGNHPRQLRTAMGVDMEVELGCRYLTTPHPRTRMEKRAPFLAPTTLAKRVR